MGQSVVVLSAVLVLGACASNADSGSLNVVSETSGDRGGSSAVVGRDEFVEATGVWELLKRELPTDDIHSDALLVYQDIIAVSVRNVSLVDEVMCGDQAGVERARLTVRQFIGGRFRTVFEEGLRDIWVTNIDVEDITNDAIQEIVISHTCSGARWAGGGVSAYRLGATLDEWLPMPATGATSFQDGALRYAMPDCIPSCGSTGEERYSIAWNGLSFEKGAAILEDGTAVDLDVPSTCAVYGVRKRLPLDLCDKGPLVRKFIALARYAIGDYSEGATISSSNDRISPEVARWIKTYRFRNALKITSRVDEELFARLGQSWYPSDEEDDRLALFDSYCAEQGPEYSCTRRVFLFPTDECPSYRPAWEQEFPLRRCDYGPWVGILRDGLSEYDGLASEGSWSGAMFDDDLEQRVRQFQSDFGLEVDGLAGPDTWETLLGSGSEDLNGDGLYGPGDIIPH